MSLRTIPCLQIYDRSIVKTIKFNNPKYIGDPINTVRIFNELEVDELVILDIMASKKDLPIDFEYLKQLTNECFMPLAYGGGIKTKEDAIKLIRIGFEKIILNSICFDKPEIIKSITSHIGSQSVIGAIDIGKSFFGKTIVTSNSNRRKHKTSPIDWARKLVDLGIGELLITSVEREGTWSGFDLDLLQSISSKVKVPIIINGGAGSLNDINEAFDKGASGVGLGSIVIYQNKGMGVLINTNKLNN
ncbi:HisA/HisF-related TIM barrel protein [Flavobacteriaceae bacterium]|nr:HisA/HisF-related TIM barrel protein [Flavobacteriaceae bacterium]